MSEMNGMERWKKTRLNRGIEKKIEGIIVVASDYQLLFVCARARARLNYQRMENERRIKGNEVCQLSVKFFENIRNVSWAAYALAT